MLGGLCDRHAKYAMHNRLETEPVDSAAVRFVLHLWKRLPRPPRFLLIGELVGAPILERAMSPAFELRRRYNSRHLIYQGLYWEIRINSPLLAHLSFRFRRSIMVRTFAAASACAFMIAASLHAHASNVPPIINGDFQSPALLSNQNFNYPATGWGDSSGGAGAEGVYRNSAYGMPPSPVGAGSQGGYINNGYIYQQIGTVNDNAIYTVNFFLGSDSSTQLQAELWTGSASPTTELASSTVLTGVNGTWTPESVGFSLGATGFSGQNLFLEFARVGSSQSFIVDVTASNNVPEPSAFMLSGLGAVGLFVAARRRRKS